jgi:hypothetical protein
MAKRRKSSTPPGRRPHKLAAVKASRADEHRLLHKRHVHATVWAIVGGLVVFGIQATWDSRRPPEKVFITNQDTTAHIVVVSDSEVRHLSEAMLDELRSIRNGRGLLATSSERQVGSTKDVDAAAWPMPKRLDSWYDLPPTMHGIRYADIGKFARVQCPPPEMFVGSVVPVRIALLQGTDSTRLSPLHVSLYEAIAATDQNRLYFVQYPSQRRSEVEVPLPTRPGMYVVEVGFFEWTSLEKATDGYAPFYRRACDIEVHERPA